MLISLLLTIEKSCHFLQRHHSSLQRDKHWSDFFLKKMWKLRLASWATCLEATKWTACHQPLRSWSYRCGSVSHLLSQGRGPYKAFPPYGRGGVGCPLRNKQLQEFSAGRDRSCCGLASQLNCVAFSKAPTSWLMPNLENGDINNLVSGKGYLPELRVEWLMLSTTVTAHTERD